MAEQAVQRQLFGSTLSLYSYEHPYKLVDIMSDVADEAAVSLAAVSVADGGATSQGGVPLFSQPMSTSVSGDTLDIYRFLALLQERVPSTDVTSLSFAGLDKDASVLVHFVFFVSPESVQGR